MVQKPQKPSGSQLGWPANGCCCKVRFWDAYQFNLTITTRVGTQTPRSWRGLLFEKERGSYLMQNEDTTCVLRNDEQYAVTYPNPDYLHYIEIYHTRNETRKSAEVMANTRSINQNTQIIQRYLAYRFIQSWQKNNWLYYDGKLTEDSLSGVRDVYDLLTGPTATKDGGAYLVSANILCNLNFYSIDTGKVVIEQIRGVNARRNGSSNSDHTQNASRFGLGVVSSSSDPVLITGECFRSGNFIFESSSYPLRVWHLSSEGIKDFTDNEFIFPTSHNNTSNFVLTGNRYISSPDVCVISAHVLVDKQNQTFREQLIAFNSTGLVWQGARINTTTIFAWYNLLCAGAGLSMTGRNPSASTAPQPLLLISKDGPAIEELILRIWREDSQREYVIYWPTRETATVYWRGQKVWEGYLDIGVTNPSRLASGIVQCSSTISFLDGALLYDGPHEEVTIQTWTPVITEPIDVGNPQPYTRTQVSSSPNRIFNVYYHNTLIDTLTTPETPTIAHNSPHFAVIRSRVGSGAAMNTTDFVYIKGNFYAAYSAQGNNVNPVAGATESPTHIIWTSTFQREPGARTLLYYQDGMMQRKYDGLYQAYRRYITVEEVETGTTHFEYMGTPILSVDWSISYVQELNDGRWLIVNNNYNDQTQWQHGVILIEGKVVYAGIIKGFTLNNDYYMFRAGHDADSPVKVFYRDNELDDPGYGDPRVFASETLTYSSSEPFVIRLSTGNSLFREQAMILYSDDAVHYTLVIYDEGDEFIAIPYLREINQPYVQSVNGRIEVHDRYILHTRNSIAVESEVLNNHIRNRHTYRETLTYKDNILQESEWQTDVDIQYNDAGEGSTPDGVIRFPYSPLHPNIAVNADYYAVESYDIDQIRDSYGVHYQTYIGWLFAEPISAKKFELVDVIHVTLERDENCPGESAEQIIYHVREIDYDKDIVISPGLVRSVWTQRMKDIVYIDGKEIATAESTRILSFQFEYTDTYTRTVITRPATRPEYRTAYYHRKGSVTYTLTEHGEQFQISSAIMTPGVSTGSGRIYEFWRLIRCKYDGHRLPPYLASNNSPFQMRTGVVSYVQQLHHIEKELIREGPIEDTAGTGNIISVSVNYHFMSGNSGRRQQNYLLIRSAFPTILYFMPDGTNREINGLGASNDFTISSPAYPDDMCPENVYYCIITDRRSAPIVRTLLYGIDEVFILSDIPFSYTIRTTGHFAMIYYMQSADIRHAVILHKGEIVFEREFPYRGFTPSANSTDLVHRTVFNFSTKRMYLQDTESTFIVTDEDFGMMKFNNHFQRIG